MRPSCSKFGSHETVRGFTLIELVVVIAIIGILAGLAYPSYQDYVTRTRRADAMGALTNTAAAFERFRSAGNFSYQGACVSTDGCANPIASGEIPLDASGGPLYQITTLLSANNRSFVLTATATAAWSSRDGALVITNTGARGWRDKSGTTYPCWPEGGKAPCPAGPLPGLP